VRPDELNGLTLTEAAKLLHGKKLSPVELTQACLERIRELDGTLRAFITVTSDLALAQARRAEREIVKGRYRGALHGIPLTLKDVYCTRGIRTTAGSRILRDFAPAADATATTRLAEAGAVLIGKTNLHEFAAGITTDNPHFGTCQNPWKLGYIPGGSSGGSGAAVAAGLGLASLGSDTGGSIRIPASFCGIVGHKPTYGLVPRTGILPESWSLDHGGPMTRTVADAAMILQTIAGHDPGDPSSAPVKLPSFPRALRRDLKGLRAGVPTNYYFDVIDPEVERVVRTAIDQLRTLGASVREVEVPGVEAALDTCFVVAWAEAAHYHRQWLLTRPQDYGADVGDLLKGALLYLATDYLQGQRTRARIRHSLRDVFRRVDVLVSPTAPLPATPHGQLETMLDGRKVSVLDTGARLTCVANLTGEPACSVPCGFTKAGLPVGLMIHGPAFEDGLVLRVAHAYELASGWTRRRPTVAG
jgi:aspartyl-tRNA(Asn)/glutamyl-tRNA(Gln) amidotransferase subunit A